MPRGPVTLDRGGNPLAGLNAAGEQGIVTSAESRAAASSSLLLRVRGLFPFGSLNGVRLCSDRLGLSSDLRFFDQPGLQHGVPWLVPVLGDAKVS